MPPVINVTKMRINGKHVSLRELAQTPDWVKAASIAGRALSAVPWAAKGLWSGGRAAAPWLGKGLKFVASNKPAATIAVGAGLAAYGAATRGGNRGYAPGGAPQVQLIDPGQQFAGTTNAFGMRSSAPITQSYNNVLAQQRRNVLMSKGASVKKASLADLAMNLFPYQDPAEMNAVQVNSPTSPAQAAIQGNRSAQGYDRTRHGLMVNQMMTPAQTRQMQSQNNAAAESMWRQNRQSARDAHSQRVDQWFAGGRKGPSPRFMSAERMMGKYGKAASVSDGLLGATDAVMSGARSIYDVGTEARRGMQSAYNWVNKFNPLANKGDMAVRNAQHARDAQTKVRQLEMQRDYMKQRLGSQWTERNAAGIDREISRLRNDADHYKQQDKSLSSAAMNSWGAQIDPVKKMQMLDQREEMLGFGSNSHLATGTNSAPFSNLGGSSNMKPPGAPGAPKPPGQSFSMSPRQHANQIRARL